MTTAAVVQEVVRDAPRAPLPPIDTNVKVPDAVRRAAERAENYYKKPVEPTQPVGEIPVVAGEPVTPSSQPEVPVVTAPVTTPVPTEPVVPTAPDDGSYEHKFKSMQGRFNSSQNQLRAAQEQASALGNELVQSQREVERLQRAQQPVQPQQRLVSDQERADYGDFVDVAARAARDALNPEVETLRGELDELRQQRHDDAMRALYIAIDQRVPNWRIINRNPAFLHWLGLRDPISGGIRKVILDGAFRAADAARVVAIFQGFVAEDATSRPASPSPQQPLPPAPGIAPAPAARQPVMALETLAAPGRARSSPANAPAGEKPIYTQRDIADFYIAVRKGAYAGREAEKAAQEQDIFAAQREGRVK